MTMAAGSTLLALLPLQQVQAAGTSTAQSIMIDTSGTPQTVAVVNTQQWRYDTAGAATYFSNAWDNVVPSPSPSISDVLTSTSSQIVGIAPANEPACPPVAPLAPEAPPALQIKLIHDTHPGQNDVVGNNQCNFLDGLALVGDSYTQNASSSTTSCTYKTYQQQGSKYVIKTRTVSRTDSYLYNYVIAPLQASYDPFTAWLLTGESNPDGTASVDVNALIAGESVSVSKNLGTKFSFSLLQNDGITPRVSNVGVAVDGGTVDTSGLLTYEDRNPSGPTPDLDYSYTANALLCNGTACSSLVNGATALGILNGTASIDTFLGNNNGGANGQALAAMQLSGVSINIGEGPHTVTTSALVKDNSGTAIGNVSVDLQVNVVSPGCGSN